MYTSYEHYKDIVRSVSELFAEYATMKMIELDSEDEEAMKWIATQANEFAEGIVPIVLSKIGYKGIGKINWIDFVRGENYEN